MAFEQLVAEAAAKKEHKKKSHKDKKAENVDPATHSNVYDEVPNVPKA